MSSTVMSLVTDDLSSAVAYSTSDSNKWLPSILHRKPPIPWWQSHHRAARNNAAAKVDFELPGGPRKKKDSYECCFRNSISLSWKGTASLDRGLGRSRLRLWCLSDGGSFRSSILRIHRR